MSETLTLSNMRAQGVHSITTDCMCRKSMEINVDHMPGDLAVPEVRKHLRCECGLVPLRTIPLWVERGAVAGKPDTRP